MDVTPGPRRRPALAVVVVALIALATAAGASAHARLSPPISVANKLQLFSLAVPTEKNNAYTTKIVLTVPKGFSIDSFVPNPGWTRVLQQTGVGENAVVQKVTWSGGHVPTGEDSLFQFLGQPGEGTFTFEVEQTYSDGQIVDWNGPETAAAPAPTIEAKTSLGGGGVAPLTIVALAVGIVGVVLGGAALLASGRGGGGGSGGGGKRSLA